MARCTLIPSCFMALLMTATLAIAQEGYVLLDPGHDQASLGAQGACDGIWEWQLTYPYAEAAYGDLWDIYYDGTGRFVWTPYITRLHSGTIGLDDRVDMANNEGGEWLDAWGDPIPPNGVDLFLSVHCNSNEGTPQSGSEILYNTHPGNQWDIGDKSYQIGSVSLAFYIDRTKPVLESAHERATPIVSSNVVVLRDTEMPGILVETEFINNSTICPIMNSDNYRNAIGDALSAAVSEFSYSWQFEDPVEVVDGNITSSTFWPPFSQRAVFIRNTNGNWSPKDYYVDGADLNINDDAMVVLDRNVRMRARNSGFIICYGTILEREGAELICDFGGTLHLQSTVSLSLLGPNSCVASFGGDLIIDTPLSLNDGFIEIGTDSYAEFKEDVYFEDSSFLRINPGATVKLDNGVRITVSSGAEIDAQGTYGNPITLTANTTSWDGIYFNQGGGIFKYCTFEKLNGSGYGSSAINISNSSPTFENCTIEVLSGGYTYAISASGSGYTIDPVFFKCTIESASGPALRASGSAGYISVYESDIIQTSGNETIYASGGAEIACWVAYTPPYYDGLNKIKGGQLYASGNAIINAGSGSGAKDKNHFCDSDAATLEVSSGATIYARYDYWPDGDPPTQINNGGTIYYSNNRGASDCSEFSALVALGGQNLESPEVNPSELQEMLFLAKEKAGAGLYDEAITLLTAVARSHELPESHVALVELKQLFSRTRISSITPVIEGLANEEGLLEATAMKMLADIYNIQNNETAGLQLLDTIISLYPNTPDAFFAEMEKFYVYFGASDFKAARQTLNLIVPKNVREEIEVASAKFNLSHY